MRELKWEATSTLEQQIVSSLHHGKLSRYVLALPPSLPPSLHRPLFRPSHALRWHDHTMNETTA